MRTMEATDNILNLKAQQDRESEGEMIDEKGESLLSKIERFSNKGSTLTQAELGQMLDTLKPKNANKECTDKVGECNNRKQTKLSVDSIHRCNKSPSNGNSEDNDGIAINRGKLKSGKCTKPDEIDILKTVKFPHEKLDSRHMQIKIFDKLPFNLLIVGELETISSNITQEEMIARVNIAKPICYHKLYLDDEDLRNGYDDIMKKVEHETLGWTDELPDKLHEHYIFRANVNLHKRVESKVDMENSVRGDRRTEPADTQQEGRGTKVEKVVY